MSGQTSEGFAEPGVWVVRDSLDVTLSAAPPGPGGPSPAGPGSLRRDHPGYHALNHP